MKEQNNKYNVLNPCLAAVSALLVLLSAFNLRAENEDTSGAHQRIKCPRTEQAIVIDGIPSEWQSNRSAAFAGNTYIGLFRDRENIYFYLETKDPELSMQIMNFGLTTWFNTKSAGKRSIGIQFPEIINQMPPPKDAKPPSREELDKILARRQENIIIENKDKSTTKKMSMKEVSRSGISARISVSSGILYYELKYPLAIDPGKVNLSGLIVETPEIDLEKILREHGLRQREEALKDKNHPKPNNRPKLPQLKRYSKVFEVSTE